MAKTKKKELQKQGLRPSQIAKAEKLKKKQEAKVNAKVEKEDDSMVLEQTSKDVEEVKESHAQAKQESKAESTSALRSLKTIHVKNADGEPDTVAEILIQNKIDYTPKVSVVMPVYNVEPYLRQTLDSVLNQTLKEIELICVDDGSTDASLDILKEYAEKDNRITIITQKNLYAGVARNAGLSQAKGKYLSFLDSDDFFEPTLLEETYNLAEKEKSQIVFYQYLYYNNELNHCEGDPNGITQKLTDKEFITLSTTNIKDSLFSLCNPMPWNKLINRELVIEENLHFQALQVSNDVCFSLNVLACSKKITLYYKSLVYYRYNRCDSLRNIRDKAPLSFYEAYKGIYNTLKNKNIYEKYKETYLKALVSTSLWTLEHTEEKHEFVKKFIRDEILPTYIHGNENLLDATLINKLKRVYKPDIIVSLTSYPARIKTVNQTIETLLNQSFKADKVILWLAPEQFPNKEADLPQELLDLQTKGLTIGWYKDIRSYKKLIPTLKLYPNAIIVTSDDDALYGKEWLFKLFQSYLENPRCVHCHRAHKIVFNRKEIKPYKQWIWHNKLDKEYNSYALFFTGVGGVLYPPHSLAMNVMSEQKFSKLCPQGDDIWFWANAVMNGTKIKLVENPLLYPKLIDGTQETALWLSNVENNQNDIQIQKVIHEYPKILKILNKEKRYSILYAYLTFPYYLFKIKQLKKRYKEKSFNDILKKLRGMRVDIRNVGSPQNSVMITTERDISIKNITWSTSQGQGQYIQGNNLSNTIMIKVKNDGILKFDFRGQEYKNDKKRLPLWIDYKSIKIDGKEVLSKSIATWHDKPYRYEIPVKDGQEITLEVEQQYHEYTENELKNILFKIYIENEYIRENKDRLIDKLKRVMPIITDENRLEKEIIDIFKALNIFRVDMKNFGSEKNNIEILSSTATEISEPEWLVNSQGIGKVLEGSEMQHMTKIKVVKDGILRFDFLGRDIRKGDKRIPILIDYESIKIDNREILSKTISVWHNAPYRYEMPVKDGQEIILKFTRHCHCYNIDKLSDILYELYGDNEIIKLNSDKVIKKLLSKYFPVYSYKYIESLPEICADLYLPINSIYNTYIYNNIMHHNDNEIDIDKLKNNIVFNEYSQEVKKILKQCKSVCLVSYSSNMMTELYSHISKFKHENKTIKTYFCNITSAIQQSKIKKYQTQIDVDWYELDIAKAQDINLKILDKDINDSRQKIINRLQNLYTQKKEDNSLTDEENEVISENIFSIKNISILNDIDTINMIKERQSSIARYGDGEIRWMLFPSFKHHFQNSNSKMSQRLKEVFLNQSSNLLLCLAEQYQKGKNRSTFWQGIVNDTKYSISEMLHYNQVIGDANITRDPNLICHIKEIWQNKDIVIVEGELSRMGVGNDLFDNAKSIKRILCPAENAFDKYDEILNECKKQTKDKLFLIALGPTATILAYDLANLGYWALDIGHIDICYEWKLRGGKAKVAIPGKYVNEVAGGRENIEDCTDSNYLNSIIAKVI